MEKEEFIELKRSFAELTEHAGSSDDIDISELFGLGTALYWKNIVSEHRVILLSEAGSGKTEEIRQATKNLIADGKIAFFLRIEHVKDGLEDAFEIGDFEGFTAWLQSGEDGWIFLDSIDEARLSDPKDFERAIRKISTAIKPAMQRSHIYITGRVSAWRPYSDLKLCKDKLPFEPPIEKEIDSENVDDDEEKVGDKRETSKESSVETQSDLKSKMAPFRVFKLNDLLSGQVKSFAEAKGVTDSVNFIEEIEKADAWMFTNRPLDLVDVIDFWKTHKLIGSRAELMRYNISRKLEEHDQDRREAQPLSTNQAIEGARVLAAACTLTNQSTIRVPDGHLIGTEIDVKSVLEGWDDKQCNALLARPIFDEAIYGTVRFHHRSAREYLTAEWLYQFLVGGGSRRDIENLCFLTQYGLDVVVPTMRPILPWLCLLDAGILKRVCKIAPEIIFEGGDPSQLPLETRRDILHSVCKQIASGTSGRSMMDYAAVQRFANPDISDDVRELLDQYHDNSDIASFLFRMVWHGSLTSCLDLAKKTASDPKAELYTRKTAIRALNKVGESSDVNTAFESFLSESDELDSTVAGEFIASLTVSKMLVGQLKKAIEKSKPPKRLEHRDLSFELEQKIQTMDLDQLTEFIEMISALMKEPPVVKRRYCELSEKYSWLTKCGVIAVEKLITARHQGALSQAALSILQIIPINRQYADIEYSSAKNRLPTLVPAWPELNWSLFWFEVGEVRKQVKARNDGDLVSFWQVSVFGSYWQFDESDFEAVKSEIISQSLVDNKKVAISLAFQLYKEAKRSRNWREQLKRIAAKDIELKSFLSNLLTPPPISKEAKKWRRSEAWYKRRDLKNAEKKKARSENWKKWLSDNVNFIRNGNPKHPGAVFDCHLYLHEKLRSYNQGSGKYTQGNWRSLIKNQGQDIAEAFRDWSIDHWRVYHPALKSEGIDKPNSTPYAVILGLVGIQIEADEQPDWPRNLTSDEVNEASRYSLWEMNGFAPWLPRLAKTFPKKVHAVFAREIKWDLERDRPEQDRLYILHDLSYHHSEIDIDFAPYLAELLKGIEPQNLETLRHCLTILLSSKIPDQQLIDLAVSRIQGKIESAYLPQWYAIWVSAEPAKAIKRLSQHLEAIESGKSATEFAMSFLSYLVGDRRENTLVRSTFKTPEYLKDLYLLMHRYIREEDDIHRAGQGVYSPGLRDDAQDARNSLFSMIYNTPGKETFLALKAISELHPREDTKRWMINRIANRAAMDADMSPWSVEQIKEFNNAQERTPSNHSELFNLSVSRLLDFKHAQEAGDNSSAQILKEIKLETKIRNFIGGWCRDNSQNRYSVVQEEELADSKKPDLRFLGNGFDAPVPVELKLADNWSGAALFERLENQLCGDYLRDDRSEKGIYLLVYRGEKKTWEIPSSKNNVGFDVLVTKLQEWWDENAINYVNISEVKVIGVDLTRRKI